ncbi:MAG: BatD family protein, partial [Verrucomicrobiota bacterium]
MVSRSNLMTPGGGQRPWSPGRLLAGGIPAGLALGALLCLAPLAARADATFDAALDRTNIGLGESATLTLTVEGGTLQNQPSPPPVPGIQYVGQSSREEVSLDGARYSAKHVISFELRPAREGAFTIPAMQAKVDGKLLASKPLRLTVAKGNLPDVSSTDNKSAFVRLVVPATNIYAGQVLPLEIKCYCALDANVQQPQLASDVFTIGNTTPLSQGAQVRVGATAYNFLSARAQITPTKAGTLTLGPATWNLTVITARDFFGQAIRGNPLNVNSDTLVFHVLPVPTNNAPPGFTGAVGRFSLAQFEAAPADVAVGDPVTLKIRVAGNGAFGNVRLSAEQLGWRDFKTYPPASKFESGDPLQIEGSKYFEQVITPQNVGVHEIPAFAFSFFDPESRSFQTLTHPAIPLTVRPAAATPQPTVVSTAPPPADTPPPAREIVNIKEWFGAVAVGGPPLIQRPGFLAWQAVAPLAWLCAWLWRRQKDRLANNPRLRRRREVARQVRQGLAELSARAAANDAENFYATVFRLLQEQLGERLDLPASAITEAVLEEARGRDLGAETEALLRELFHACDQFRYTPDHTASELASLIPKVKTALAALRAMTPPAPPTVKPKITRGAACALLLLAAAQSRAGDPAGPFDQANTLYEKQQYAAAAAAYEKIAGAGPVSAALFFNLGNAWFKAGHLGRAIAAYRRAEELAPRDADVRANLQFARGQAGVGAPAVPGNVWTRWVGRLTLDEWTKITSVFLALFFIVLTARQIYPAWRKSSAGLATALAVACLWWAACLGLALDARFGARSSVVIVPEAVVRNGPLDVSPSAFVAHDGAELLVLDRKDDWLEVTDAAHHKG